MVLWKKNLLMVWLSQFFCLTGFWFAMPFIPYYIQELGVIEAGERNMWISIYTIAGYISVAAFSPIWGRIADSYGRKPMLLRACYCSALIVPLMGFVSSVMMLVFIRFAMGVFSGTCNAAQALISSETPQEKHGFALGMLSSAIYSGSMAGCLLGGIIVDFLGYKIAFWVCGFLFFVSGLFVMLGVKEGTNKTVTKLVVADNKDTSGFKQQGMSFAWLILMLILFMGLARQLDTPFFPLLVQDIHGSIQGAATWTGIIAGITALAGMLAGPVLGMLSDKISAPRVAIFSALLSGLFMLPHGIAYSMGLLIPIRFMMIFFAGGLDPIFQIWLSKSTPKNIQGAVFGWALTAKCIGWIVAAGLSGWVATFIGLRWIYAIGCLMFFILIPMIVYTARKIRAADTENAEPCKNSECCGVAGANS